MVKIERLAEDIAQQEIDIGLRKKKRSPPAKEVFERAIKWSISSNFTQPHLIEFG